MTMPVKQPSPSYEQAIAELETIVAQMETGHLPLEESIAAYQRGAELVKLCQQSLSKAEQHIQLLNEAEQLIDFNANNA
jgi:exodeoxyribonuclease VII small subunit